MLHASYSNEVSRAEEGFALQVMDRIEGRQDGTLPWEDACMTATYSRRLGVFRNSLMALVSRDPSQRPSLAHFCATCHRVLAGSTSVEA